jgi:hypothetical protein
MKRFAEAGQEQMEGLFIGYSPFMPDLIKLPIPDAFMGSQDGKRELRTRLQAVCQAKAIVFCVFAHEVWMIRMSYEGIGKEEGIRRAEEMSRNTGEVSQHPDRMDMLMLSWSSLTNRPEMESHLIKPGRQLEAWKPEEGQPEVQRGIFFSILNQFMGAR